MELFRGNQLNDAISIVKFSTFLRKCVLFSFLAIIFVSILPCPVTGNYSVFDIWLLFVFLFTHPLSLIQAILNIKWISFHHQTQSHMPILHSFTYRTKEIRVQYFKSLRTTFLFLELDMHEPKCSYLPHSERESADLLISIH